jgi:hypothetical protein
MSYTRSPLLELIEPTEVLLGATDKKWRHQMKKLKALKAREIC